MKTPSDPENHLPDSEVIALMDRAMQIQQQAMILRRDAVRGCAHAKHEVNGGHAYCTICAHHIGDPCRDCGHMLTSFMHSCTECGAF